MFNRISISNVKLERDKITSESCVYVNQLDEAALRMYLESEAYSLSRLSRQKSGRHLSSRCYNAAVCIYTDLGLVFFFKFNCMHFV